MTGRGLAGLRGAMHSAGASRVFAKRLAANDNSKNQVYLGGDFTLLNELPLSDFQPKPSKAGRAIIHAMLRASWLLDDGTLLPAPHSKVVLYPQYPEVRWSGFLKGAVGAPTALMDEDARLPGRVLLIGVRDDRSIVVRVEPPTSAVAIELEESGVFDGAGILVALPEDVPGDERDRLLTALRDVAARGWVDPVRLNKDGSISPCTGPNCGGVTLESLLGISPNSRAEPDFHGWEVKQFGVKDFVRYVARSPVTVFTPEPTAGAYATHGVEAFIRRWGYPDAKGRPDRLNIGGTFAVGGSRSRTNLTLRLDGLGEDGETIVDAEGGIQLVDPSGTIAAKWPFASLLEHWNRKHARAAYVPSIKSESPTRFRYAPDVYLAFGTDFGLFLRAMNNGLVYYDPGIKLEAASTGRPQTKRRSQFRVRFPDLPGLYRRFESVVVLPAGEA